MIFCHQCGASYEDGTKFCAKCGIALNTAPASTALSDAAAPAAPQPPIEDTAAQSAAYAAPTATAMADGRSGLAAFTASPLFLATLIAYTAGRAVSLISMFINIVNTASTSYYYADGYTGGVILGSLLAQILPIAICIGLWLVWLAAKNYAVTGIYATGGFTTLKVTTTISLVLACIGCGAGILCGLLFSFGGGTLGYALYDLVEELGGNSYYGTYLGSMLSVLGIFMVLFCAGALVLLIFYYKKMGKTIRACLYTLASGSVTPYVSMLVIVMGFIIGGFAVLSALLALPSLLSFLSEVSIAVSFICCSINLLQYKKACGR